MTPNFALTVGTVVSVINSKQKTSTGFNAPEKKEEIAQKQEEKIEPERTLESFMGKYGIEYDRSPAPPIRA